MLWRVLDEVMIDKSVYVEVEDREHANVLGEEESSREGDEENGLHSRTKLRE